MAIEARTVRAPQFVLAPTKYMAFNNSDIPSVDGSGYEMLVMKDPQGLMRVELPEVLKGRLAKYYVVPEPAYRAIVQSGSMANELDLLNHLQGDAAVKDWAETSFPGQRAAGFPVVKRYLLERDYRPDAKMPGRVIYSCGPLSISRHAVVPVMGGERLLPPNKHGRRLWAYGFIQENMGEGIMDFTSRVRTPQLFDLLTQFAVTGAFLESMRIMHGDWKPGNMVANEKGQGTLIDFQLTRRFDDEGNWVPLRWPLKEGQVFHGFTEEYASPEQLRVLQLATQYFPQDRTYKEKLQYILGLRKGRGISITEENIEKVQPSASIAGDVYSFGLSVIVVIDNFNRAAYDQSIIPRPLKDLLLSCWELLPKNRPTFKEVAEEMVSLNNREIFPPS